MKAQINILSTKNLLEHQKKELKNFLVDEANFIQIEYNTDVSTLPNLSNVIFTSKNAVMGLLKNFDRDKLNFEKVYCVGDKTSQFLQEQGIEVILKMNSAKELALEIIKDKSLKKVTFFCGNLRRNDLPQILSDEGIKVNEVEVYKTKFKSVKLEKEYNAVLFFSPSSIKSYIESKNSTNSLAFCIGNTTANEAIDYFENVFVADEPTVEHVIKSVNQYFDYE